MMTFATRARPLLVLLSALLWLVGVSAQQVHHLAVRHVTCPEHGEILELSAHEDAASATDDAGPSWEAPAGALDHDQACGVPSLAPASAAPAALAWAPPADAPLVTTPRPRQNAPRGPPLAFAPKTSPPALT